ncbi:ABC transporter permease [Gryllotalpicola ginsengisoli]|uniref:ABC transporter permease n=1 Tax=Gryllotalpicola ginsengisoli TaxID=444608 RepID=UPI0003B5A66E|nr:ABC transporter permease [Gryllotalpicola ginsengisoli]
MTASGTAPTRRRLGYPSGTAGRAGAHPLLRYIAVRFGISVLLLWGVTLITFILTNLVPANPVAAVLGETAMNNPRIVAATEHRLGLDKPLPVQYGLYLWRLLHLDFGTSNQTQQPILDDLKVAFPATIELALYVMILSVVIGLGLAIWAALTRGSVTDLVIRLGSLAGISVPLFWLAMVLFYLLSVVLGVLPGSGRLDPTLEPPPQVTGLYTIDAAIAGQWDVLASAFEHLALPVLVLTLYTLATLVKFFRSALLDVVNQEYVVAARAKGLPGRQVVFGYILRGALLPILTMTGLAFGSLLSGAVMTETVFSWQGLGQYALQASTHLDMPAIMGVGIVIGAVYIAINFVIDLLYGVIDPRVRRRA